MPILTAETSVFPGNLLEDYEQIALGRDSHLWWVLHTRPRQEKSIARDLLRKEVAFYLPVVPRRLLIRGRAVHSHVPLFSGYVFLYGTPEHRQTALATKRIAQSLAVTDGRRLRDELASVQRLIETGAPLTVESRLEANCRVRVRSGALAGLEGIVARRKNETRLVVWMKMLQQGVSLEIEDFLLEPI